MNFVKESAELGRVFAAGAGFDAAGHIDRVGAHDADGFGDIFGRETACKDNPLRLGGGTGEMPVCGGAGTAKLALL